MNENPDSKPMWPLYAICYAALTALAVCSFWLMQVLAQSISHIGLLLDFHRYVMTALNQWSFVILGILWLITFFWMEHYLRGGIKNGMLWPRIGKITAWVVGLMVLAYGIQMIPIG